MPPDINQILSQLDGLGLLKPGPIPPEGPDDPPPPPGGGGGGRQGGGGGGGRVTPPPGRNTPSGFPVSSFGTRVSNRLKGKGLRLNEILKNIHRRHPEFLASIMKGKPGVFGVPALKKLIASGYAKPKAQKFLENLLQREGPRDNRDPDRQGPRNRPRDEHGPDDHRQTPEGRGALDDFINMFNAFHQPGGQIPLPQPAAQLPYFPMAGKAQPFVGWDPIMMTGDPRIQGTDPIAQPGNFMAPPPLEYEVPLHLFPLVDPNFSPGGGGPLVDPDDRPGGGTRPPP